MTNIRIGNGYDIHRLAEGRKLILGGIHIPFEKGLLGHSDADVLTHAVMDAMLGALALGDIGKYFPPNDPKYKDRDSLLLLKEVKNMVLGMGYRIVNIDSIIQAEKPKLINHTLTMRHKISEVLEIAVDDISIKATTMEGLGPVGEVQAIASHAVVLLAK